MQFELLEQTARHWVGQDKQEECSRDRAVEPSVQHWIEAMKDIFASRRWPFKYVQDYDYITTL
jgi:hypothetical protein